MKAFHLFIAILFFESQIHAAVVPARPGVGGAGGIFRESVSIGDNNVADSKASLDVKGTGKVTLLNRGTTAQRTAISSPPKGSLYFDTDLDSLMQYTGSAWEELASLAGVETLSNKILEEPTIDGFLRLEEQSSTPATPSAGYMSFYVKEDRKAYLRDSDGNETAVGTGSGGGINWLVDPLLEDPALSAWETTVTGEFDEDEVMPNMKVLCFDWAGAAAPVLKQMVPVAADGLGNSNLNAVNISHSFWIKASFEGLQVHGLQSEGVGDAIVSIPEAGNIPGDFTWREIAVTSVGKATTTSVGAQVYPTNSNTGKVCVAAARVGPNEKVGTTSHVSEWTTFTPTGAWSNTNYFGKRRRVGDSEEYQIRLNLTGNPSGTFVLDIPSDRTVDESKLPNSSSITVGTAEMLDDSATQAYGANVLYDASGNRFLLRTIATSSSVNVSNTVPFTFASSDFITLKFTVPIVGWSASDTASVGQGADMLGTYAESAFNGCPGGSILADGSAVSRATYAALFNLIGTEYGSGDGSTTFNLPDTRALVLRATGTRTVNGRTKTGPTNAGDVQEDQMQGHVHNSEYIRSNATAGTSIFINSGLDGNTSDSAESTADKVVKTPATDGTNGIPRTGTETRVSAMGVTRCIYYVSQPQVLITQAVTTPNTDGVEQLARAQINCDSGSAITSQSGPWLSVGNISSGTCALTVASGVFASAPTCVAVRDVSGPTSFLMSVNFTSATAGTISCNQVGTGACASFDANLICMGSR